MASFVCDAVASPRCNLCNDREDRLRDASTIPLPRLQSLRRRSPLHCNSRLEWKRKPRSDSYVGSERFSVGFFKDLVEG